MMEKYKYKFSIIMSVYNVEKYIEEAIESVINQSIGFERNVQLILINDGSTDDSEEICKKYQKIYSENIIYKKQTNKGLSG
ncbi:MAG TPA: glycosyltransferase family 2 protein, partial [Gallicola sp.]|nr:glycosyltransferase family 2 protein [Gallicola sp.]